jgi:hypothetical protein
MCFVGAGAAQTLAGNPGGHGGNGSDAGNGGADGAGHGECLPMTPAWSAFLSDPSRTMDSWEGALRCFCPRSWKSHQPDPPATLGNWVRGRRQLGWR